MHFDWIAETGHRTYSVRDDASRKRIRKRATQSAVLTKQRQNSNVGDARPFGEMTQIWPLEDSTQYTNHTRVPILFDSKYVRCHTDMWAMSCRSDKAGLCDFREPTPMTRPMANPEFPASRKLVKLLQTQPLLDKVLKLLHCDPVIPDGQVRYFAAFALGDPEYLYRISTLYGRSDCLDAAITCLTARLYDILVERSGNTQTAQLYLHALKLLQQTIARMESSKIREVYYAIPLLTLIELLDPHRGHEFMVHARGAIHVLHAIGPANVQADFDRTLLVNQSDMMVVENIQDRNEHCCVAVEWQQALFASIKEEATFGATRSEASITLNVLATAIPRMLNDVEESIIGAADRSTGEMRLSDLNRLMAEFRKWYQHWQPSFYKSPSDSTYVSSANLLLAIYYMYVATLGRLIAAAPGHTKLRLGSEVEAFQASEVALSIAAQCKCYHVVSQNRLILISQMVRTVYDTSSKWQEEIERTPADRGVDAELFRSWCSKLGRSRH